MKKKGVITAAELMSQLNSDPEYQARKAKKDAEIKELEDLCAKDEAELVADLNKLGLEVKSVWDLVNNSSHEYLNREFVGSYEVAYPLLVKHLKINHHQRIREGVIRSLSEKGAKEIAVQPLIEELRNETMQSNKWVIANALNVILSKSELGNYPEVKSAYDAGYL